MLVQRSSADIVRGDPDIHRVLTFDRQFWRPTHWRAALHVFWDLWRPRYDLAISVCGDIGSIATRLTRARRRVGYAGEAYGDFMTDPVPGRRYATPQHEVQYVLALAAAAGGIVAPGDERPQLTVDPAARERMAGVIAQARAATGAQGPLVTLHAGARNGQAKRWPTRHCAALADHLRDDLDALVILTGAPNETSLADEVTRQQRRPAVNLCGQTTTRELAALLALSDVVVSGDSGPMHIACAVGAPVVVLHGPTDPHQSGPTDPDAIILRRDLWCSPCYDPSATADCRFGNPVCMKEIAPSMVFAAVRRQLARHAPAHEQPGALSSPAAPVAPVIGGNERGDERSQ
jgi:lipopolysaccharide heptosyltransferase II